MAVTIGVLGCASIALRRTLPAMSAEPTVEIAAVASRDRAKAEAVAKTFDTVPVAGYDALLALDELDAIYVPLPTGLHARWVRRALLAGKHVLCEKPMTTSRAETAELVALAAERGVVLMENFMFLHHSQHQVVRDLVADGAIGTPRVFGSAFGIPPLPEQDVRYQADLGGGTLLDVGVYPLRAAQLFLGPELDVVGAHLHTESGVDTRGHVLLADQDGVTAELSFGFEHAYHSQYTIWGSAGRIVLDRAFTPPAGYEPVLRIHRQGSVEERSLRADDQFANVVRAFAAAVVAGGLPDGAAAATVAQADLVDRVRTAARR